MTMCDFVVVCMSVRYSFYGNINTGVIKKIIVLYADTMNNKIIKLFFIVFCVGELNIH